jgi:hypothetical protein
MSFVYVLGLLSADVIHVVSSAWFEQVASIASFESFGVNMVGKKSDDSNSKYIVMIQRVIQEVGSGSSYPALTKTNYSDWTLLMKVKLKAQSLSRALSRMAAISKQRWWCGTVSLEMSPTIIKNEMVKEAWDTIVTMRDSDHVKKSTAQQLRRKLELTAFDDGARP